VFVDNAPLAPRTQDFNTDAAQASVESNAVQIKESQKR
jgi:hypothetical protein